MRAWAVGALGLALLAACSSSAQRADVPTSTTRIVAPRCAMPTRFGADGGSHEVHARGTHGSVWGLATGPGHVPPRPGEELKIVWRVTGRGPLHVVFTDPRGRHRPLVFGPRRHAGSTYHRPGDEWGTGFRFGARGCWHIHLARDGTAADAWLDV